MNIYKYVLPLTDRPTVTMPVGARILHVGNQLGDLCLWAEVDPKAQKEERPFMLIPTGGEVPLARYLGTALLGGGALVFHVYDAGPE